MPKLEWPIARKEGNRVAIWLDLFTWPILRDGVVRKYLELREEQGALRARNQARQACPETWKLNKRLRDWAFLDQAGLACASKPEEALALYRAGFSACLGGATTAWGELITPEKLVGMGDKQEAQAHEKEMEQITALALNHNSKEAA